MWRKLKGWIRLYVFGVRPNCCGDQENLCPICGKYFYIDDFSIFPATQREVWTNFKKLVDSKNKPKQ